MSPTTNMPVLSLDNISLKMGQRLILTDIELRVKAGEIISIIGPNGAGKTSLVKIMVGLLLPTTGTVSRDAQLVIGYMPQKLFIDPIFPITVERFLQLGLAASSAQIKKTLKLVGVANVINQHMQQLSGGQFQRVLLARALLRHPQLLVLDEPVQGVDLLGQAELYDLIAKIRDELNCAIVLVSHDLHVVMAKTDTVLCLNQHICCLGSPEKVGQDPAFTEMFGQEAMGFARYTHRHDHHHHHDDKGRVIPCEDDHD